MNWYRKAVESGYDGGKKKVAICVPAKSGRGHRRVLVEMPITEDDILSRYPLFPR